MAIAPSWRHRTSAVDSWPRVEFLRFRRDCLASQRLDQRLYVVVVARQEGGVVTSLGEPEAGPLGNQIDDFWFASGHADQPVHLVWRVVWAGDRGGHDHVFIPHLAAADYKRDTLILADLAGDIVDENPVEHA